MRARVQRGPVAIQKMIPTPATTGPTHQYLRTMNRLFFFFFFAVGADMIRSSAAYRGGESPFDTILILARAEAARAALRGFPTHENGLHPSGIDRSANPWQRH